MIGQRIIRFFCFILLITSCADKEADELRRKLSSDYTQTDNIISDQVIKSKYRDVELAENKYFVSKLSDIIENSFEKQISSFEDSELGFFKSYKYMAYRLLRGEAHNRDFWHVKTKLYFSNLDIQQDAYDAFLVYNDRVKQLRTSYLNETGNLPPAEAILDELNLPNKDISLAYFDQYSLNNIFIEFGADIAGWLLVLAIGAFLSLFRTVIVKESKEKLVSAVAFVVIFSISLIATNINDKKLLSSIRDQGLEINTVSFESIQNILDCNTINFYHENNE